MFFVDVLPQSIMFQNVRIAFDRGNMTHKQDVPRLISHFRSENSRLRQPIQDETARLKATVHKTKLSAQHVCLSSFANIMLHVVNRN